MTQAFALSIATFAWATPMRAIRNLVTLVGNKGHLGKLGAVALGFCLMLSLLGMVVGAVMMVMGYKVNFEFGSSLVMHLASYLLVAAILNGKVSRMMTPEAR